MSFEVQELEYESIVFAVWLRAASFNELVCCVFFPL